MRVKLSYVFVAIVLALSVWTGLCRAEANISVKQGFVYSWKNNLVKNITAIETVHSIPIEEWGKWNVFIDGWTLDVGAVWDIAEIKDGALLLGREFGTLGKYLPLEFPFKDKIKVTIYPIGIYMEDVLNHPKFTIASGGAFVKLSVKF